MINLRMAFEGLMQTNRDTPRRRGLDAQVAHQRLARSLQIGSCAERPLKAEERFLNSRIGTRLRWGSRGSTSADDLEAVLVLVKETSGK
jgi:hypothetical protein